MIKIKARYRLLIGATVILLPIGWLLAEVSNDKAVLYTVLELIKKTYVEEVTDKKLVEAAISGMLTDLDPHSRFFNEKDFEDMKVTTKGEFGGIGIEIMIEAQGLRIISPIDDTPAFKAGVKPGDLVFAINDEMVANMTPGDAINKMRGPKDTKVKISIIRDGLNEPLEMTLSRDIIKANPVKAHLYHDIGYVRIASFSNQTTDSARKAIEALKKEAGKTEIKGFILDLRNNPGGLLEQSVYITDLFLDQGVIVSTRGKDGKEQMLFKAENGSIIKKNIPLVVLINNGSASASEIVAGALQDNKRALIVGTKSFGKGSVQTVIPLPNYGAISLTTARYYTPSGRSIQAEGIMPDIVVEPAKIELLTVKDKKMQFSEASLRNHLTNQTNQKENNKDSADMIKNKAELWAKLYEQDYQLARSIDILKSMQILQKW